MKKGCVVKSFYFCLVKDDASPAGRRLHQPVQEHSELGINAWDAGCWTAGEVKENHLWNAGKIWLRRFDFKTICFNLQPQK